MCGILGITKNSQSEINNNQYKNILNKLFILSETRGKEASGFAFNDGRKITVFKTPFQASELLGTKIYKSSLNELLQTDTGVFSSIGHSRLVTNGTEQYSINNQPVIKNGIVCVHNGIIVNHRAIWNKYDEENKNSELDSELIPTLFYRFYSHTKNISESLSLLYSEIYGMTSFAAIFNEYNNMLLSTNNGSLYYLRSNTGNEFIFASERYILNELITKLKLDKIFDKGAISRLLPNTFCLVDLITAKYEIGKLNLVNNIEFSKSPNPLGIQELQCDNQNKNIYVNTSLEHSKAEVPTEIKEHYESCFEQIKKLKRCSRCLLPETFPFISFDEDGVCSYCNNYKNITSLGESELVQLVNKFRHSDNSPDCLVPFSGGRDSCFVLHYIKTVLKMNPIAFSYDWGMLTDLARRNQSRMCGKLGVEHILISADIRKKRKNIQENVSAWLKRPNLGTIPLFMAGDKQYFYYANLLMNQNKLQLSMLGENLLESTKFKSGFCGIKPKFDKMNTYSLSIMDKLRMTLYYGKEYLLNPSYLNSSLLDTIDAFKSYYIMTHKNINIFNYLKWNEKLIEDTLINEYDWETDPETRTTWRIGDGTAAFYNYIYLIVAGFSENDTFRSNQIREGMLSRNEAYKYVIEENKPRWNSIKWYCDTIGIDFIETIKTINKSPRLYHS